MLAPDEIHHFRQQLQTRRDALRQRIDSLQGTLAAPEQRNEALDRGDDAILLREHDDVWDQLAFARDELALVDKALARIEAGTYGISEVSGKPIPRERLEAEPTATTLVGESAPE